MYGFIYLDRGTSLRHEYVSPYANKQSTDFSKRSGRYNNQTRTKSLSRVTSHYRMPPGGYKSKYYDPDERHERYLKEKTHATRPYGTGKSSGSSGGKGGGKGRGGGQGNKKAISDVIAKLREESSLDTEAHREAAKRQIEELREELRKQVEKLQEAGEEESYLNVAEIKGKIQDLKRRIEATGNDLSSWVSEEKEALQRRIAKLKGEDYDKANAEQQAAVKGREKEISSRADAIYKRKSKK